MATNKERIKKLKVEISGLQESVSRMERGFNDKMHHLEEMINQLSKNVCTSREGAGQKEGIREVQARIYKDEMDIGR